MPDPINGLTNVVDILRQQLLAARRTERTSPRAAASSSAASPQIPLKTGSVKRRTRERIAAIDRLDPNFYRKARRAFLQVVLGDEFGEQAASDPAFFQLLEDVETQIDADEKLNHAFEELFKRLGSGN